MAGRPLLRLLFPEEAAEALVEAIPPDSEDWAQRLATTAEAMTRGSWLLLVLERSWPRAALRLVRQGRWDRNRMPRMRRLREVLVDVGLEVRAVYALWPSAERPRIAYPRGGKRAFRWIHWSGVLGGGGHHLLVRAVARSRLSTPFVKAMTPAVGLLVARSDTDDSYRGRI